MPLINLFRNLSHLQPKNGNVEIENSSMLGGKDNTAENLMDIHDKNKQHFSTHVFCTTFVSVSIHDGIAGLDK
jgi:hypothetical protein